MEFFLWFWMLDRRWVCSFRPPLKYFTFLWLIPIVINLSSLPISVMWLFPFNFSEFGRIQYIIIVKTAVSIISIVCSFIMMYDTYSNSKIKLINVLNEHNCNTYLKDDLNESIDDDFWISRKSLICPNGIIILLMSILQIVWSIFYLLNKDLFKYDVEKLKYLILSNAYLQVIFCAPICIFSFYAFFIKVAFVLSANFCSSCVLKIAENNSKNRNKLAVKLDFSDVQKLEPEFVV